MQLSLLLILFINLFTPVSNAGDHITGEWISVNSDGDKGIVKIYRAKNGLYYGKLVSAFNAEYDKKIKSSGKPLFILKSFQYSGSNEYTDGVVIRPKFNDIYRGKLELKDKNTLRVTGYLSILSKSIYWERKK